VLNKRVNLMNVNILETMTLIKHHDLDSRAKQRRSAFIMDRDAE